jgi:hypothetical protein
MILKWMFPGGKSLPHVIVSHNARFDPVSYAYLPQIAWKTNRSYDSAALPYEDGCSTEAFAKAESFDSRLR